MKRATVAKYMLKSISDDLLLQRSRFAACDIADANLRTRFFGLIQRTPTFSLTPYLLKAIEIGNAAYVENIYFELPR